jgi:hypothetical protein
VDALVCERGRKTVSRFSEFLKIRGGRFQKRRGEIRRRKLQIYPNFPDGGCRSSGSKALPDSMESDEPPMVARPHPSDSLLLSGGDHRFAQSLQGDNARGLNHFVDLLGFWSGEALPLGTRVGSQVMGLGNEPGQLKEGYLAAPLLVDGDPLEDFELVVREKNLHVILKEGA